ncbi:phosphatidylserine decarboxylase [Bacillus badius]|uniref:phosphatidylserine decarboxylase n=1 Tax=Bacillus badius TaxID=1455 RepID=A0ABR5AY00_BACBA|nr:phosphatidylserine decarboxylase [Bacillus badius]KIL75392.1 Phosphatidylserine decarboxylase [Bacillus badius]KIL79619.1 Phosphatidylserine decarboxylase [Bacillus badius]KZN98759.1 phosphatidylserine decarboxylase [Bacillus badius]KZR57858.1 phosphatidylserine decarboxylase [Bacillus badius]MED0666721.1 phosphatidylserine decarboxylase [Bacillus badius]
MQRHLYRFFIELTNKRWSSRLLERYTSSSVSKPMIRPFIKAYRINEEEMAHPADHYQTLHDFFIRQLLPEARVIEYGKNQVVSPVDALLAETGVITSHCEIVVKEKPYSVAEMLGSREKAADYENGTFLVFYLSPGHYHRIHSPIDGQVTETWALGRHSYPVNSPGLKYGKAPLAKNYREITELTFEGGKLAVVKVGAMFVNSIERSHNRPTWKQGEEVAYFNFGSTVVLLFEPGTFRLNEQLAVPCEVKVGETVGTFA